MKRKAKLITWLVAGIILGLGPVWGVVGSVFGMLRTFNHLSQQNAAPETLAHDVSLSLYMTVAGWIACLVGIVIIIVSAVKLSRLDKEIKSVPPPLNQDGNQG